MYMYMYRSGVQDACYMDEDEQVAYVKLHPLNISKIILCGLIPSEKVQITSISCSYWHFHYADVINILVNSNIPLTENFKLAAVTSNRYALGYMIEVGIPITEHVKNIHTLKWEL